MAPSNSQSSGLLLKWLAGHILCVLIWPGAAAAGVIQLDVNHYVASLGNQSVNYFDGALLTENDLSGDQSYKRSANRYIGETELDLSALFDPAGFADVSLFFDEADALFDKRTDVKDSHDRYADDFILLDPQNGTWLGRLYLEEQGDILAGVYDDLSGTFSGLVIVAEPAPLVATMLGLVALGAWRRRVAGPTTAAAHVKVPQPEGDTMAFKPNYNQQRSERDRLKRAKKTEKMRVQQERTALRKAGRAATETDGAKDEPAE